MIGKTWQLQDAQCNLSEVISHSLADGPQVITRDGVAVVVVVAYVEFRKARPPQQKLSEFFAASPLAGSQIDLTRDQSPAGNEIEL